MSTESTSIRTKAPKLRGGAVGENRIWTTCENGRHELTIPRKRWKAHRVDTVVHRVESTGAYTLMHRPSIDSEPT